ncbi:hypothetical protein EXS73_00560 [Candidatus Pacearchaeota archaeon]|nr:hypothetical protein [Candidatus Pacearchaeota archaeon]
MKRGQEEIVGFAVLLVVLAIVGVILLGMYLRSPVPESSTFPEGGSFLDALPQVTSSCALTGDRLISVHELLVQCIMQPGKQCASEELICTVMNNTLHSLVTQAFPIGSRIEGYRFTVSEPDTPPVVTLSAGNCTSYQGDQRFLPGTGYSLALFVCT